jgi:hypothetical protein
MRPEASCRLSRSRRPLVLTRSRRFCGLTPRAERTRIVKRISLRRRTIGGPAALHSRSNRCEVSTAPIALSRSGFCSSVKPVRTAGQAVLKPSRERYDGSRACACLPSSPVLNFGSSCRTASDQPLTSCVECWTESPTERFRGAEDMTSSSRRCFGDTMLQSKKTRLTGSPESSVPCRRRRPDAPRAGSAAGRSNCMFSSSGHAE